MPQKLRMAAIMSLPLLTATQQHPVPCVCTRSCACLAKPTNKHASLLPPCSCDGHRRPWQQPLLHKARVALQLQLREVRQLRNGPQARHAA